MTQRPVLASTLGVLTALSVALWLTVFARSSPSGPSASDGPAAGADPVATASPSPSASTASAAPPDEEEPAEEAEIELTSTTLSGEVFETVPLSGVVPGADEGTTLRVQHRQDGRWVSFPLPTATDAEGAFTAYVELGRAGTYELRVRDPRTARTSPPITLVIG